MDPGILETGPLEKLKISNFQPSAAPKNDAFSYVIIRF